MEERQRHNHHHYDDDHSWKPIYCGGCGCVTIVILTLAFIASCIILSVVSTEAHKHSSSYVYKQSEELRNSPFAHHLDGSGAPLAMTLPNDLTVTKFLDSTFSVTAQDAAAHTLTITLGALPTTFDGGFTIATFDGNVGSTITFKVVAKDRIHIISAFGVALS